MKTIKILHMYADMLDLYGDSGNMEVLQFRCNKRGINCQIDKYSIDSEMPDFSSYDLVYIGGGADLEQQHISEDLLKCKDGIIKAYKNGTFLFLICGGYQLMGKYYRDADGNDIKGLGLFDYFTVAPNSRRKRCIGNIVIETKITGKPVKVVGFENQDRHKALRRHSARCFTATETAQRAKLRATVRRTSSPHISTAPACQKIPRYRTT